MIQSIIYERELMSTEATNEVSAKWAEAQQINGPILTIPVTYEYVQDGKDGQDEKRESIVKYWHILPQELEIIGHIDPEKLRRGIYEVVVYKSNIDLSGSFNFDHKPEKNNLKQIHYGDAFLTIGIGDLRGIKNSIALKWGDEKLKVSPGSRIPNIVQSGITVHLPDLTERLDEVIPFEFQLSLQGSQNMSFVPLGSTTEVQITSGWPSPSFNGNFLPDSRELTEDGFSASWKILQLNRNFPESWMGAEQNNKFESAAFGVDLILPLDDYQKSMRSAKYAVMTIALTFLIFFLVEVLNKRRIHPFQYALVGLALCLFYVLLVSITEHSDFNFAFGISTVGIVSMIALYSLSVFKKPKLVLLLTVILTGIYGFLFVTLQLEDYALLMGSAGLTVILGATMYFTRNIDWYKINIDTE
jgi:inner membrane protein